MRTYVRFNSSNTAGRMVIKLGTIDQLPEGSVAGFVTSSLRHIQEQFVFKLAFPERRKHFFALTKASPPSYQLTKDFIIIGSKIMSQVTLDCTICFLYFLKTYCL